jgi:hypothetical protein
MNTSMDILVVMAASHLPSPISHLPSPISHLPSPILYLVFVSFSASFLSPSSYVFSASSSHCLVGTVFSFSSFVSDHVVLNSFFSSWSNSKQGRGARAPPSCLARSWLTHPLNSSPRGLRFFSPVDISHSEPSYAIRPCISPLVKGSSIGFEAFHSQLRGCPYSSTCDRETRGGAWEHNGALRRVPNSFLFNSIPQQLDHPPCRLCNTFILNMLDFLETSP